MCHNPKRLQISHNAKTVMFFMLLCYARDLFFNTKQHHDDCHDSHIEEAGINKGCKCSKEFTEDTHKEAD